ncbi:hypothetical protein H0H87_002621 [Tephrocybe sp. NHM501043]|nr:hypothetical protein H0H87_002621 [Tephrocybe sp. NHM501043]
MLVTTLILTSALVTVLETVPTLRGVGSGAWFGVETCLVVLFTIEYIARCVAWSASWRGLAAFFGIIDLLAVMPYYIEIMLHQDTSVLFRFSILRMFRLLRVFKPFRYNNTILLTIEVMYVSVRRSQHALLAIGFFVAMILTVFSTLLYFAERGTWDPILDTFINADGDPSQFSSIPAAAWFVLVTITTVGYGEITPRSFLGRLITLPILMFGLLLITLPSFVLGREFSHNERSTTPTGTRPASPLPPHSDPHDPDSPLTTYFPPATPFAPPTAHSSYTPLPLSYAYPPYPPHLHHGTAASGSGTGTPPSIQISTTDLTNRKLAHNQTELSRQIEELRRAVERQGEVVFRLLEGLNRERERGEGQERKTEGGQGVGDLLGIKVKVEEGEGKGKGVEQ